MRHARGDDDHLAGSRLNRGVAYCVGAMTGVDDDDLLAVVAVEGHALPGVRFPHNGGEVVQPEGAALEQVASRDRSPTWRDQEREVGERDGDTRHGALLSCERSPSNNPAATPPMPIREPQV
jgi:hypothetical protein